MKKLLLTMLLGCSANPTSSVETDAGTDPMVDAGKVGGGQWYTSGSRIKMRTLNTPDGARQYVGWRDTLLNDDCTFVAAADGVVRCLPNDAAPHLSAFSDAACSIPAVVLYTCNPLPKYIEEQVMTPSCASSVITTHGPFYIRGAQLATVYQKIGAGSCSIVTLSVDLAAYGVGAEVPLTSFQSATVGTDP